MKTPRNYVKKHIFLSCKPKIELSKRNKILLDIMGDEAYVLVGDEIQGAEYDFIVIDEWSELNED